MKPAFVIDSVAIFFVSMLLLSSKTKGKKAAIPKFQYEHFKDSVIKDKIEDKSEAVNMFDAPAFTPGIDSIEPLLVRIDTLLYREATLMMQLDTMKKGLKKVPGFTEEEKAIIRENIKMVDSFLVTKKDTASKITCMEKDCIVYVEIDKSKQTLYLYILGPVRGNLSKSCKIPHTGNQLCHLIIPISILHVYYIFSKR